ncbi:Protein of Unknown function [Variovorax sp. HW608]|nr:Protein of Unknown function [Variovorax sp. HW608]
MACSSSSSSRAAQRCGAGPGSRGCTCRRSPWAIWIEWSGRICPLTPLENEFRRAAGLAGYGGGFIEHYLLPAIYPDGLTRGVQIGLGALVALVNLMVYARLLLRR